jgi:replicative DNA helicase
MERLLAARAEVNLRRLRDRNLDNADWERIAKASADIRGADTLAIHDGPELSVQGIRAELRAMRRAGRPAALLLVDYLTLVEPGKAENRQLEVSGISRKLKLLAKEFGIPVLVAAALNRGPEQRSDHHPLKADLRDSGSLEQDSDIVILLYRDDEYFEDSPHSGEIELIVAKNRQGPKATVTLAFQGHYAKVAPMYQEPWSPSSPLDGAA